MSLLPSRPDTSPPDDADPRVIGVDSEDAEEVLSALSSETARKLLSEVHDDPAPPSELADRVDTSLQNAQYHLEKLEAAGAVAVVDTAYSAKGREMDVYAPADQPLVIFAGDDDDGSLLRRALSRLLGAVGLLGVASLTIQQLFGKRPLFGGESTGGSAADTTSEGADGATATPDADALTSSTDNVTLAEDETDAVETAAPDDVGIAMDSARETATETATETMATATETATATADATREAAAGLPPGLVFFAGGLFAIAVVAGVVYLRQ